MFTSRRLLKGPKNLASLESGFARGGRVGGVARSVFLSGLVVRAEDEVKSAVSSGEYAGGRDVSTPPIIGGGLSAVPFLRYGLK